MARPRSQASNRSRDGARPNPGALPREVISELRKVTWPSREETVRLTIMVLIVSAMIGLFLGAVDYIFNLVVTRTLVG
ncbi:MAG: preprotein translocase subunit SecE [Dehalococcoidia bacterium]|jgi:preprotein translocase subunit SecE|nr:preprotein translocase subunit SecE [Dehalococcoidia bacterium]